MFQGKELESLRLQKERLALQSDVRRQLLLSDWRRLQSSELWLDELLGLGRRPGWAVRLATAAGTLVARTLGAPGGFGSRILRLGKFAAVLFSAWRLIRRARRPP